MSGEGDDEDIGHDQQDEKSEPRFGLLDALMAENRQPDNERLAEHREEDRIGEPRRLGDHIVDADSRQHGLHPAPAHEDDDIGGDRQEAALGAEGTAGDGHGRQARTGADVADEREHDGADDRPENDDDDRCGEVDAGNEQSSGQQGRDDEVRGQPDHEHPSPAQGPADDSGIVPGFQSLFRTAVPVHSAASWVLFVPSPCCSRFSVDDRQRPGLNDTLASLWPGALSVMDAFEAPLYTPAGQRSFRSSLTT